MKEFDYVSRNLRELKEELDLIAKRVGAPPPKLVSVTKSGTDEELLALCKAGACAIGENRPGELKRRGEMLLQNGFSPELHQIGTLQSNKAKLVFDKAALIHSLDSLSLAKELNRLALRDGIYVRVLVEINSAEETQKSGVLPSEAERFIWSLSEFERLKISGLMTMGPAGADDGEYRRYFSLTKQLFDKLHSQYGFGDNPTLSMGMSDSYRVAVEEGSNLVRVGRRLFMKNQED